MKKIYVFRGSPASGKGTVTEAFVKKLEGKVAFLELDKFRWEFHLLNRSISDITEDEHQLAYDNYLSVLENYLKDGSYTIVTEGLFSWGTSGAHGNMKDILSLVDRYEYDAKPVLLYADFEKLWERNLAREYSVPEDEFRELYDYAMKETSDTETKINVGIKSVEESVSELLKL